MGVVLPQGIEQGRTGVVKSVVGGHQAERGARTQQTAGRVEIRGLRRGDRLGGVRPGRKMIREMNIAAARTVWVTQKPVTMPAMRS
jgi:hypothetical protein